MKVHEYQAKKLFQSFNIPTPRGDIATTPEEAHSIAERLVSWNSWGTLLETTPGEAYHVVERLGSPAVAIKAQIHAGGRGKAGGVKIARSLKEVKSLAEQILGMTLVTPQTGPQGKPVRKVLVEEVVEVSQELYLSIIVDGSKAMPVVMMSKAGGMEIEEIASRHPELILRESIHPLTGLMPYQTRNLAIGLGLDPVLLRGISGFLLPLYNFFIHYDCSMVEVNPLVITADNRVLALDAKINFDDNALFRHKDLLELRDPEEDDPLEREASAYDLNYIRMEGNVGAMVNGAGLAMATMDLIKLAGAEPANFLDVGGGASTEMVTQGFKIIASDPRVKAILINIFGGILRCDVLAQGVIEAAKTVHIQVPLIVRMEGTNVDIGRRMLQESGLDFLVAGTITEAAEMVARAVSQKA
jgi:succinyl-CoA synthetase beta subunit